MRQVDYKKLREMIAEKIDNGQYNFVDYEEEYWEDRVDWDDFASIDAYYEDGETKESYVLALKVRSYPGMDPDILILSYPISGCYDPFWCNQYDERELVELAYMIGLERRNIPYITEYVYTVTQTWRCMDDYKSTTDVLGVFRSHSDAVECLSHQRRETIECEYIDDEGKLLGEFVCNEEDKLEIQLNDYQKYDIIEITKKELV